MPQVPQDHILVSRTCTSGHKKPSPCFNRKRTFKKNVLMFIYFRERERERERAQLGEGQREREIQNPKQGSRLLAVSTDPDVGFELTNCEIMT